MPGLVLFSVATFVVSLLVARMFLRMRCRKIGPPFGRRRRARYWANFIVVSTAVVSTAVGLLIVAFSASPAVLIGVVVPGGLWFTKVPPQRDLDYVPRTWSAVLTLPFLRLYERIGDDMQDWCDTRCEAAKPKPEYIAHAVEYYWYQMRRVKDPEHRARLDRWRESIAHKINTVRLIDLDPGPDRLAANLELHRSTANARRYVDDDQARLARKLETEALNELHLFLCYAYQLGYHDMLIYPFRPGTYRPEPQPPKAQARP